MPGSAYEARSASTSRLRQPDFVAIGIFGRDRGEPQRQLLDASVGQRFGEVPAQVTPAEQTGARKADIEIAD
jgi:hypothetical protein